MLNHPGTPDPDDPLRADARAVRRMFVNAVEKAPADKPFFVFLDNNAPSDADADWQADVQRWMGRLPEPMVEVPDLFNAAYVTYFSPHYDADSVSPGGPRLLVWPRYARVPLQHGFQPELMQAFNAYGRVPAFTEDATLLD